MNGSLAQSVIAGAEANARLGVSYDKAIEAQQRMRDGQKELASEFETFVEGIVIGGQKMGEAFSTLAKSLNSNALKAIITGDGPLAEILGMALTEKGQLGGLYRRRWRPVQALRLRQDQRVSWGRRRERHRQGPPRRAEALEGWRRDPVVAHRRWHRRGRRGRRDRLFVRQPDHGCSGRRAHRLQHRHSGEGSVSTFTAYAKGRRVLIVNDTAGLDGDGIVRGWISKVATVPHLRMAITTRGAIAALPHIATNLVAEFSTFDAAVAGASEFLFRAHDHLMMRLTDQAGCKEIDLGIVGWSTSRRQCETYAVSTLDHPGWPAFTLQRNDVFLAPTPPLAEMEAASILSGGRILDHDPEGMLMAALELQRRQRVTVPGTFDGHARHIVCGQAVFTEITEVGIT